MTAPSRIRSAESASWPLDCLWFYSQMTRDFGRCAQALSQSTDAMEAARAEADFGVRLFGDLMRAYYDLAMAPWMAMAAAMARQAADFPTGPFASIRTGKSHGRAAG